MVSEKICLDIVSTLYGKVSQPTVRFFPNSKDESVKTYKEANASDEKSLYKELIFRYQLQEIDSAIRWLEITGYLSKVYPFGMIGKNLMGAIYKLSEKGCNVAKKGAFIEKERQMFYPVDPYSVFVARQFNNDDQELYRFIKEDLLEPEGFKVYEGNAEGLEQFRDSILNKIRDSRFFLCLLTKRIRLESGGFVSSVWLYQEIGASMAFDKSPLVLVEEGIDKHFTGELQKNYEYIEFSRSNYSRILKNIPIRLKLDLERNLIPLPNNQDN